MCKLGRVNKNYIAELKISVIMDMREHHLRYRETMRKYFPELKRSSFKFCIVGNAYF